MSKSKRARSSKARSAPKIRSKAGTRKSAAPHYGALEELEIIVGQLLLGAVGVEVVAQRRNDEPLNFGGGNAAKQSRGPRLSLQHGLGHIIAVAGAALVAGGVISSLVKK